MRGNIAAEIKAVDEHFKPELMIFCTGSSGFKENDCRRGAVFKRRRDRRTELASDPKNPVVEDDLGKDAGKIL